MPTYQYETIPSDDNTEVLDFEIAQSMKDALLTHHSETCQPVCRVISSGFRPIGVRSRLLVAPDSYSHHDAPYCRLAA